jgi:hypothetical protein
MSLSKQQEHEIYPILDKVLELPPNKGVLRECSTSRADYLSRMIKGIIYDTAVESIEMYDNTHPLYGLGSYGKLWAEPHERGLLITRLQTPLLTLPWQLIQVAAFHQTIQLIEPVIGRCRQRLARFQRKYPTIMNKVWISADTDPPEAYYGELSAEQTLVVDIDVNPSQQLLPTHIDYQKIRMRSIRNKGD